MASRRSYQVAAPALSEEDQERLAPTVEPPENSIAAVLAPVIDGPPVKVSLVDIVEHLYSLAIQRETATTVEEAQVAEGIIMEMLSRDLPAKVDAIAWVDRKMDNEIIGLDEEILRIERRKATIARAKQRLRNTLLWASELLGGTLRGRWSTISKIAGRKGTTPDIYDESSLPDWCCDQVISRVPNKQRILNALEAKEIIPGARLKTGEDYIRIT